MNDLEKIKQTLLDERSFVEKAAKEATDYETRERAYGATLAFNLAVGLIDIYLGAK